MARQTIAELHQGMLVEIARRQRTAEPGVVPEEKREKDHQQGEQGNEQVRLATGTFGAGGHASVIIALREPVRLHRSKLNR